MKKLTIVLLSLVLIGMAGSVWAVKPAKSEVLHCGCVWDDFGEVASMEYKVITINSKSRGHDAHYFGSMDACFAGQVLEGDILVDVNIDFVRTAPDCQLAGPPLGDPIDFCTTQEEADAALLEVPPVVLYVPAAGDECGTDED